MPSGNECRRPDVHPSRADRRRRTGRPVRFHLYSSDRRPTLTRGASAPHSSSPGLSRGPMAARTPRYQWMIDAARKRDKNAGTSRPPIRIIRRFRRFRRCDRAVETFVCAPCGSSHALGHCPSFFAGTLAPLAAAQRRQRFVRAQKCRRHRAIRRVSSATR